MKSRFHLAAVLGLALIGGVVVSSLTLLAALRFAVVPVIEEIEKNAVHKDLLRVENAFEQELERIDSILKGYSERTSTYDFVSTGSGGKYLVDNYGESYLKAIKLDFVLILDDDGRVLFDLKNQSRGVFLDSERSLLKEGRRPAKKAFVRTELGLLLVSSRPITNDTATVFPRGAYRLRKVP